MDEGQSPLVAPRLLVVVSLAVIAALYGLAVVLFASDGAAETWFELAQATFWLAAFTVVGAFMAWRVPANRLGWLSLALAAAWLPVIVLESLAPAYVARHPEALSWLPWVFALLHPMWAPGVAIIGFLILRYPSGRLVSRSSRVVARVLGVTTVLLVAAGIVQPDYVVEGVTWDNPLSIGSAYPEVLTYGLVVVLALCLLVSAGILLSRFRTALGVERMQLKWLASAGAVAAVGYLLFMVISILGFDDFPLHPQTLFALIPIAIGFAVLRYRLYDIDRIVSRTVAYGLVVVILAAAYAGLVMTLRGLLPLEGALPVAVSTLAVAFAFLPLLRRVQRAMDRRFFRSRYDAASVLDRLVAELRHNLDPLDAVAHTEAIVAEVFAPTTVSVWMPPER